MTCAFSVRKHSMRTCKGGETLKWYQRILYRVAMSVLPTSIKKQMIGVGRITTPSNANPWNFFSWLPKKYQQAHNIDLTKLQSYTAEELLELLISVHPDISHALYTYLRMGDTGLSFTAKKANGNDDKNGQRTLDEIKAMLNTPLASPGYQHGRSLDKLDTVQRMMVMVRGACAGEVVLNEACNEVVDIVPVDPSLIWFKRDPVTNRLVPWQYVKNPRMRPGEVWFGQYKQIDTPTFIYEEFDPMVDDPYGRTPYLPVLQVVFFHLQVLQDLKAVVHNQGYPRLDVSMMEEIMLKNMPPAFKMDPTKQRQWLSERMEEMQKHFNSLNPDDALFHYDSVKVEYLKGTTGPMIDVKKLIDIIDTQMATSLKTLLTILSRHQGSTETYSSVDTQLYIKMVESGRGVTKRFWKRAISLSARIKGVQTNVDADYQPIDLRSENEVEKDRKAKIGNIITAESQFYITPTEAAQEVRWTLGLDPKLPVELLPKLEKKHEPDPNATPPPNSNRILKLDSAREGESNGEEGPSSEGDSKQFFIALYMSIMMNLKSKIQSATSLDRLYPELSLTNGMQDQILNGMWQMYRQEYANAYNQRATATNNIRIRNPDTNTSVKLYQQAQTVVEGTTATYQDSLLAAIQNATIESAGLPKEQILSAIKSNLTNWIDENDRKAHV